VKCELCPAHGRRTGGPYRRVLCIPALCWAALPAEAQISWNPTPSFFFLPSVSLLLYYVSPTFCPWPHRTLACQTFNVKRCCLGCRHTLPLFFMSLDIYGRFLSSSVQLSIGGQPPCLDF
jgi:hypothetical protein